jgi:hypothetical protein
MLRKEEYTRLRHGKRGLQRIPRGYKKRTLDSDRGVEKGPAADVFVDAG